MCTVYLANSDFTRYVLCMVALKKTRNERIASLYKKSNNMADIGRLLGISRERVRMILKVQYPQLSPDTIDKGKLQV